ncbi:MAG: DMT family transporter [Hormoscilla sp.]
MTTERSLADQPMARKSARMAIGSILIAIVALSQAAILIRLNEIELSPMATIFNRFWISFAICGVWHLWEYERTKNDPNSSLVPLKDYTTRDLVLLIGAGVMFWACLISWAWSLTQTGVANSTILHNLTPLFITLGAWALFGQKFDKRFLIGLLIAMVGAIGLGLDDLQVGADNFVGDLEAFGSALFSAGNLMIIEKLRDKFTAPTIIMWCCGVGAVLCLPIMLIAEDHIFPISALGWLWAIGMAFICQIVGQGLQAYSLKRLSSGLVGIFLLLDPVFAALTAWVVFSESLSLFNWAAFGVVLAGIYLAKSSHYADRVIAGEDLSGEENSNQVLPSNKQLASMT